MPVFCLEIEAEDLFNANVFNPGNIQWKRHLKKLTCEPILPSMYSAGSGLYSEGWGERLCVVLLGLFCLFGGGSLFCLLWFGFRLFFSKPTHKDYLISLSFSEFIPKPQQFPWCFLTCPALLYFPLYRML